MHFSAENVPIALFKFGFVCLVKRYIKYWSYTQRLNLFKPQYELKWVMYSCFNPKQGYSSKQAKTGIICACKQTLSHASWWFSSISLVVLLFLCDRLALHMMALQCATLCPGVSSTPICSLCAWEPHHGVAALCCFYTACIGMASLCQKSCVFIMIIFFFFFFRFDSRMRHKIVLCLVLFRH